MATHIGTAAPLGCDVPVFYATTEGQTRRIAERLASILAASGLDSRAVDMASRDAVVDWSRVRAALIGASLHAGRHQVEACVFVRKHASRLNAIPSAFFSVSLSAASGHPEEVAAAERFAAAFPPGCGWRPSIIVSLAGRLAYTQYGFLKRLLMKRIARREGAPIDTTRDYELTDWTRVERLAQHMDGLLSRERGRDRSVVAG